MKKDHGSLSAAENAELLRLEDLLPIETLLSFHLLALRKVVQVQHIEMIQKYKGNGGRKINQNLDSSVHSTSPKGRSRRLLQSRQRSDKTKNMSSPSIEMQEMSETTSLPSFSDSTKPSKLSSLPKKPGKGRLIPKMSKSLFRLSPRKDKSHQSGADDTISLSPSMDKQLEFDWNDDVPINERDEEDQGMVKTIRCNQLSLIVSVRDKSNNLPVLKANLKASTWIHHTPGDGMHLLFDLKNFDFVDCTGDVSSRLVKFEVPDFKVPEGISTSMKDDIYLETFCDEMHDGELAMPPSEVVSRLLITERPNGRSISLSAYAATMIWNKTCVDAFMNTFFPSQNLESRSIIQNQLRNAATPIAHKAQVALTSPKSLSINVNIDAPKVLFPISQNSTDGALFVDVGKMTLVLRKPEFVARMRWEMDCTGINVNFRRFDDNRKIHDIPIILPLALHYEVERSGDGPATITRRNGIKYKQSKVSKLVMSEISIRLVDVEVLSKAIGKWYASELSQVKKKRGNPKDVKKDEALSDSNLGKDSHVEKISQDFSISVEKIELYLQGPPNKSSLHSSKRTYLVELKKLNMIRSRNGSVRTSTAILQFINIALMKELPPKLDTASLLQPESRFSVLKCSKEHLSGQNLQIDDLNQNNKVNGAIMFTFIHDESTHIDDLDLAFNGIEIRVTSTSLRDCYGATKRVLEVIRIMTGEMERRVHLRSQGQRKYNFQHF